MTSRDLTCLTVCVCADGVDITGMATLRRDPQMKGSDAHPAGFTL